MLKILITAVVVAVVTSLTVLAIQDSGSKKETISTEKLLDDSKPVTAEVNGDTSLNESDPVTETPKVVTPTIVSKEKILDLSKQGLTKAPSYIFQRTEIQELNLSNNDIGGALQAEVRHLQNLKKLNLSNNQFTGVPAEVGQLKNLEVLDLSNNELTGLPYELGNLSNLKVLNLRGNDYSTLDLGIIKKSLPASTIIQTD